MSVTVTTVEPSDRDEIAFHNGFAWFLDSVFGGKELPDLFFTQGVAESPDDPGALTPVQCAIFANAIHALSDQEIEDRMWTALNGREADADMAPAIATVRALANLAREAGNYGGLRTRDEDASGYVEPVPVFKTQGLGYEVTITRSDGADGAVVIFVDGPDEGYREHDERPDGSPGCRIQLNDERVYTGTPYEPKEEA